MIRGSGSIRPLLSVLIFSVVAAAGILMVLGGALDHELLWDSLLYRTAFESRDPSQSLLLWAFRSFDVATWHPLTWLSYAMDAWLYGELQPAGLHRTNLVFHWLATCSAFLFLLTLLRVLDRGVEKSTTPAWTTTVLAGAGALLWALHPQRVESVVWVAGRKDVLCTLFVLLSLTAYLRSRSVGDDGMRRGTYVASVACYALAVLSKPAAVVVPPILLLLEWHPLGGSGWRFSGVWLRETLARTAPFWLLALVLGALTVASSGDATGHNAAVPLATRLIHAVTQISVYLQTLLLPLNLSPFYPFQARALLDTQVIAAALGILAASGLTIFLAAGRREPGPAVAWFAYLVALFPVLGLLKFGLHAGADRFTYLPTLALVALAVPAAARLLRARTRLTLPLLALGLILIVGYGSLARTYATVWQDRLTLWTYAARSHPEDPYTLRNLAGAHYDVASFGPAAAYFAEADRLQPTTERPRFLIPWAYALMQTSQFEAALVLLGAVAEAGLLPECTVLNRVWNLAQLGRLSEARRLLDEASPGLTDSVMREIAVRLKAALDSEAPAEAMATTPFCGRTVVFVPGR